MTTLYHTEHGMQAHRDATLGSAHAVITIPAVTTSLYARPGLQRRAE